MAQQAKYIDLTRTFLPADPETFPQSEHATSGEDAPEQRIPVMPYEGWNIMPTAKGYRSYFGLNATLDIDALPSTPDEVFIIQTSSYENILVALCNDGIYSKDGSATGAWTQKYAVSPASTASVHYEWTFCVINNILYIYRQGYANGWKVSFAGVFSTHTPSYITMSGQMGIFKAGGRLGFWDSSDAVAWSSYEDKTDFTPSVTTQANVTTFTKVIGRIVTIKQCGDGFIIYATKSIIRVRQSKDNVFQWTSEVISGQAGIAYPRQVAVANPDSNQYAWTTIGLMQITDEKVEIVATEVYDYLKEGSDPVYLKMIEGRYLFLELQSIDLIYGRVQSEVSTLTFPGGADITYSDLKDLIDGTTDPTNQTAAKFFSKMQTAITGSNLHGLSFIVTGDDAPVSGHSYYAYQVSGAGNIITSCLTPLDADNVPTALSEDYEDGTLDEGNLGTNFLRSSIATEIDGLGYMTSVDGFCVTLSLDESSPTDGNIMVAERFHSVSEFTNTSALDIPAAFVDAAALWDNEITWLFRSKNAWRRLLQDENGSFTAAGSINVVYTDSPVLLTTTGEFRAMGTFATSYLGVADGTALPETVEIIFENYYIPSKLSNEQYSLMNNSFIMYKTVLEAKHYKVKQNITTTGAAVVKYVDTADQTLEGGKDSTAAWLTYWDTASPGGAPHTVTAYDTYRWEIKTAAAAHVTYLAAIGSTTVTVVNDISSHGTVDIDQCKYALACAICPVARYTYDGSNYVLDGSYTPLDSLADFANIAVCTVNKNRPAFGGIPIASRLNQESSAWNGETESPSIAGTSFTWNPVSIDIFPITASTFLLQAGSPAPINPTMRGAFVYDTQYKRWGKLKADFKVLLDFAPINIESSQIIPYDKFGVSGALINTALNVKLFDANPTDSYIKYGKIGLFRLGVTTLEEVICQFGIPSTCTITTETSLDGKSIESGLTQSTDFTSVRTATHQKSVTGKWHNIKISGQFDLTYLQFNSYRSGRR